MRKLLVHVTAVSILFLFCSVVPRSLSAETPIPVGPPPTIDGSDTQELAEFLFFFQHLANLDAAADAAEAAGNPPDASSWRSLDQRAAGLTDQEGAILKQVAYGCNQALRDHDAEVQAAAAAGT